MAKVFLGIPVYKFTSSKTFGSHLINVAECVVADLLGGISAPPDMFVSLARNDICKTFLSQGKCTHLWFVDDDIVVPGKALHHLLNTAAENDAAVVSGMYPNSEGEVVAYSSLNPLTHISGEIVTKAYKGNFKPVEVAAVGMGCCLIRRDVIEIMDQEYGNQTWFQTPFEGPTLVGEDIFFCERLNELGIKILLDTSVVCNHLKSNFILELPKT